MNMRIFKFTVGAGLLGAALGAAPATAAILVDGKLTDWGVIVKDFTGFCGTDAQGSCIGSDYTNQGSGLNSSFVSSDVTVPASPNTTAGGDRNDVSNSYIHIPGSPATGGGQNYDVNYMAAVVESGVLYVGISTGQRPDNGFALYSPGDIRVLVNGVAKYGIEVGGGAGGGAGSTITEGADGTTYGLNGNGHVDNAFGGVTTHSGGAARLAGDVVSNTTWIADPIGPGTEVQLLSGTEIGVADLVFTRNDDIDADGFTNLQHAVIEIGLDLSLIGAVVGDSVTISWGPSCANDLEITTVINEEGDIVVPAPAALPIFLLGLSGLALLYRRRRAA